MSQLRKSFDGRGLVEQHVAKVIGSLQTAYLSSAGSSWAKMCLARLRRGAGKVPGADPLIWSLEFEQLPEALMGTGSEASAGEWATHVVLTLYATHQQSRRQPMHVRSVRGKRAFHGIGDAVRILVPQTSEGKGLEMGEMPRRFASMVTAESIQEVAHYARQLVQQLRTEDIPLDYVHFAGQLYDCQNPYRIDSVRLEWAREYARSSTSDKKDGDGSSNA